MQKKLNFTQLITLVITSMVAAGIFGVPASVSEKADVMANMIGWGITGVGMYALAVIFQTLAIEKPSLNNGMYAYARAGFGDFVGFVSGYGYWIAVWAANIAMIVMVTSSASTFFPSFGEGNTIPAIVAGSVILWIATWIVNSGYKEAGWVSAVITFLKFIPIFIFIVISATAFKMDIFTSDIWGLTIVDESKNSVPLFDQIKSIMASTAWVFVGIESASVISKRAANREDIGKATIFGFIFTLIVYIAIIILSFGIMQRAEMSELGSSSLAGVFKVVWGETGENIISIGVILSILGGLLGWVIPTGEILQTMAKDNLMSKYFAVENKNGVPSRGVILATLLTQIFLISVYFTDTTYNTIIIITTEAFMLPYLLTSLYSLKDAKLRGKNLTLPIIATIYSIWLVYAIELKYLLIINIPYILGVLIFMQGKKESGEEIIRRDKTYMKITLFIGFFSVYLLTKGYMSL